ncbi:phloretin 4'-O-glucosyltransferase [Ziziphus jujuba]|uniref:Glycosyltransferase n=1 Tax=Ziziphus jujuba TaxID=326968 RepID=A0ABM3IPW2_ZIZJJ|nr:phloretin 4'-O-glucosyltransferase [Ziziphus jujuba]
MAKPRLILVLYAAQGHINPGLQLAERVIAAGAEITLVTTIFAHRRIIKAKTSPPAGLSFAPFSDGYDEGLKPGDDVKTFVSENRRHGKQALSKLIDSGAKEGRPFTGIVYSLCQYWVAELAHELQIPTSLLWVEPATVFDMYYYYFHGYEDIIKDSINNPSCSVELPGLPLQLTGADIPSFMDASKPSNDIAMQVLKEQFEVLEKERNPKVLVNTFDDLEPEALKAITEINLIGIGPLIPITFYDGKEYHEYPSETSSFRGDLEGSRDWNCMEWMNSKPKASIVYVSFGTVCVLPKQQMEEIGGGLLDFGQPFLWVITEKQYEEGKKEEDELSCIEELEKLGKIVPWCSQMEVLSNPSLGCFVTHCGWNSTLESLVCGVPMVAFPRWIDQGSNAKLIEDSWKTGLRVKASKEGIVERDEIKRCLELVMGDGEIGEEIRRNAKKWKDLGREAVKVGGSSNKNFKAFVNEIISDSYIHEEKL